MPLLTEWDLRLDADAVLRGQGADPAIIRTRNMRLVNIAAQALEEGIPMVRPQVLFASYDVASISHNQIKLSGGKKLKGELLLQQLVSVQQVIVFVCTIGPDLEALAAQAMENDMVRGLALYGVGSAAVEALANAACSYFEKEAEKSGLQTTIPLSPGMIGWDVEQGQPQIFSLVDGSKIGVELTERCMMLPLKSLSMVIGVGKNLEQKGLVCDFCEVRQVCKYQSHSVP